MRAPGCASIDARHPTTDAHNPSAGPRITAPAYAGRMSNHGLLLAAGAGTRMGRPKALVDGWLTRAVDSLESAGCDGVTVVLGAGADEASALLADAGVEVRQVVAADWADGMGASLRAGLESLDDGRTVPTRWSSPWSTCPTSAPRSYGGCSPTRSTPRRCAGRRTTGPRATRC